MLNLPGRLLIVAVIGRVVLPGPPVQEDELEARAAKITQLGMQVASEGRQRAEERRGRTEAERRLRAEKQVRTRSLRAVLRRGYQG